MYGRGLRIKSVMTMLDHHDDVDCGRGKGHRCRMAMASPTVPRSRVAKNDVPEINRLLLEQETKRGAPGGLGPERKCSWQSLGQTLPPINPMNQGMTFIWSYLSYGVLSHTPNLPRQSTSGSLNQAATSAHDGSALDLPS